MLQIEPTHHAVMPLLHQKRARAGLQAFLDQPELALAQTETLGVLCASRFGVWKEHLGRSLLDDGPADGTIEDIARALCCHAHHTIQLSPGLGAILRKTLESGVREQPPELIHPTNQTPAVQELTHEVEE